MDAKRSSKQSRPTGQFKRSTLAVMIMAASGAAVAQDIEEIDEEVVVQGIRANIADAAEMKRNADTHMDAISAEDIGSLPDLSVLEALQRVPGISIERFAAADDPDHYSVEGSGLILRGLPQTRSEFNGRDAFSASSDEGINFQDISPELMGAVEVIKNYTADMTEGGISGTVNLVTRKPFDTGEPIAVGTIGFNYSDHRFVNPNSLDNLTPSLSALVSNAWDLDMGGRMGMLLSHANSETKYRTDGFEAGLWRAQDVEIDGETVQRFAPESVGIRTTDRDNERQATSFVWQYENESESFDATFEYFQSISKANWLEAALFQDEPRLVYPGDTSDLVFNDTEFVSGRLVANSGNVEDGHRSQKRRNTTTSEIEDFSLNLNWKPTDALTLTFDVQRVEAVRDALDISLFGGITVDSELDFSSDIPDITIVAPGLAADDIEGNRAYFTNPQNYIHLAAMDHIEESEGEETAFELEALYEFDDGFIDSIHTGVRFAEREQTTRWARYNWGVLSAGWNGDGRRVHFDGTLDDNPWDGTVSGTEVWEDIPEPNTESPTDFFRGHSDSGVAGGAWLSANSSILDNYDTFVDFTNAFPSSAGRLGDRAGTGNGVFLPDEINPVTEEFGAAFIRVNWSALDDRLTGNIGLRHIEQDVVTEGGVLFPNPFSDLEIAAILANNDISGIDLEAQGLTADQIAGFDLATADDIAFANGGSNPAAAQQSYSKVLPSLHMKYELADDMFIRFGLSESVAFPKTGLYRYSIPVDYANTVRIVSDPDDDNAELLAVGLIDAEGASDGVKAQANSTGNPFLKPMESINVDLSWEWYFGEGNSLAIGGFYKDIKNFFATGASQQDYTNNGVTQTTYVNSAINSGDGKLSGLEFAYSQFWGNGLGFQFNYTYLQEDNIPNQNIRTVDADNSRVTSLADSDALPLQGLSENTFNIVGIYEKDAFSARLAYNYRSEYMLTQSQVNLNRPQFSEAVGNLDGSIAYEFTENVELAFTAANILDNVTETSLVQGGVAVDGPTAPRNYFMNDRRFALKLTVKM